MPEKVTAYRCKYRCGERASIKKQTIENHEYNCFHNPRRKACKTCRKWDVDEDGSWCSDEYLVNDKDGTDKYAIYDCEHWVEKKSFQHDQY